MNSKRLHTFTFLVLAVILILTAGMGYSQTNTGWLNPTAYEDPDGDVVNPGNMFASDDARATFNSADDEIILITFSGLAIPAGSTISGIAVRIEGYKGANRPLDVRLRKQGGGFSNYETDIALPTSSTNEAYVTVGGSAALWGTTWVTADFGNLFGVELNAGGGAQDLFIDHVQVMVYYDCSAASITTQPSGYSVCAGGTATALTVVATGTDLEYQWFNNDENNYTTPTELTGETSATFTPDVTTAGTYYYFVRLTADCGDPVNSNVVTVTVNPNLPVSITISSSDEDDIICAGNSVTFTATPTNGGAAPTYKWFKNNIELGGETAATYTTTGLVNGDQVKAELTSNALCATGSPAMSNTITTTVYTLSTAPTGITSAPMTYQYGAKVCPETEVTLTVTGGGLGTNPAAAWTWYAGGCGSGTAIGTGTSITVDPLVSTTYYVRAEGGCNTTACAQVTVWVYPPTEITVQPQDISTKYGCPAPLLSVTATGHNLQYQWYKNTTDSNTGGTAIPFTNSKWYLPEYTEIGTYYYYVVVTGTCGTETSQAAELLVEPQIADADGMVYYTGPAFAFTANPTSSTATVVLSAVIKNNMWLNCFDGSPTGGDIRTARMSFEINKGNGWEKIPSAQNLPVDYVDPNNVFSGGTASAVVQIQLPSGTDVCMVDIKVVLSGNYKSAESLMYSNLMLVVPQPGGKIAGGVWLCNHNSTGFIKGTGFSLLFFQVEYSTTSKKSGAQNPKGKVNLYVMSQNGPDGTPDGQFHWYKISSNAIASLSITSPSANFTAKANVEELHWDGPPTSLEGNCTMVLDVKDGTTWPYTDLVGITVYRNKNNGGVWYSNNWVKSKTVMAPICGGGLTVTGGSSIGDESVTELKSAIADEGFREPSFVVYPNPFRDKVTFEFVPSANVQARLDVFDITGRLVNTVFDNPVESGVMYRAEFSPQTRVSGMYFYRLMLGQDVFNGKVVYEK